MKGMQQRLIRIAILTLIMLSVGVYVHAQEDEPSTQSVTIVVTAAQMSVGESALIDVLIDCPLNNCAAVDIVLVVDPAFLEIQSLTLGDFPVVMNHPVFTLRQDMDAQNGSAHLIYVTQGTYDATSGGLGVLLQLSVQGLQAGEPVVQVSSISISDFNGVAVDVVPIASATQSIIAPTPTPEHVTITLEVQVEARTSDTVQAISDESTTVSVDSTRDTEAAVVQLSFEVDVSPQDEVILSASGHLNCSLSKTEILSQGGTEIVIRLNAGDANADGVINDVDVAVIRSHDPVSGDINGDQTVNVLDLIHTGRNFGMVEGKCQ